MKVWQVRNLTFAGILLLVSAGTFLIQLDRTDWIEAEATVSKVTLTCMMKATERGVLTKTTSTAEIDCDDVEAFKRYYPDQRWTTTERFASVLLFRTGATFSKAEMDLSRVDGRAPRVGDRMPVIYDPDNTAKVALPKSNPTNWTISAVAGALGFALLFFTLRSRAPKPETDMPENGLVAEAQAAAAPQAAVAPQRPPARRMPSNPDPIQPGRRTFGKRTTA